MLIVIDGVHHHNAIMLPLCASMTGAAAQCMPFEGSANPFHPDSRSEGDIESQFDFTDVERLWLSVLVASASVASVLLASIVVVVEGAVFSHSTVESDIGTQREGQRLHTCLMSVYSA